MTGQKLAEKLNDGIEAIKVRGQKEIPDHQTRHRFLETILKLKGLLSQKEVQDTKPTILFADLIKNVNIQVNQASTGMRNSPATSHLSQAGINGLGVPVNQEGPGSTPDPSEIIDGEEIPF